MAEAPKRHVSFSGSAEAAKSANTAKPGTTHVPSGKAPSERWKIPQKYEVKSLIGTGSYGSVCEAYNHSSKKLVAIKRIGHLFEDLVDCKRVLREIAILSRLDHDNVVRIFDIVAPVPSSTFDELYIVMEICDSDLKKLCRTEVTLTPLHVNTLLYNLLVGLRYLHSAGVYHRDMKPANCLVNQDCSIKICDFGLARAIGDERTNLQALSMSPREDAAGPNSVPAPVRLKRHLTGHVVTRWYRAPELILLQENYTEAIDVWSVGCIYAELLGMLEGTKTHERGPLFPGSSCFPLSPDNKHKSDSRHHNKGKHDQLNMIFNLLGTPSDSDVEELERDDARRYIRCFSKRDGEGLQRRFLDVSKDSLAILELMLRFNPRKRTPVDGALQHPLFNDIRDPARETLAREGLVTLEFEKEPDLDESLLRAYFAREIRRFQGEF